MAEVLSQSEIDALLSALSSGDVEAETINSNEEEEEEKHKVKQYDFKTPQKFSKDHIRTLERVHDNFARITSNFLTGQLRKSVKVNVENVEQITYEEFMRSIPNPTIVTYFKLHPLQGNVLMELNPVFSFQILDVLLGGNGKKETVNKDLTDIEKNIISKVCKDIISSLNLAWAEIMEVTPEFDSLETNPAANQTLAPNEPVALISFLVEFGSDSTYINLCIPYLSIEKVLDKLIIQYWLRSDLEDEEEDLVEIVKERIKPVELELRAELGKSEITVEDFLELVVGDVIKLDSKIVEPIKMYVEDEECYIAKPGIIGKMAGVELLDTISKDVSEYE
ncbi:MAG: flagellar motor switch protein FliM [Clostridium sp.]|nr:flagellar motor switch protein FliM [Clostridium sp.]